MAVNSFFTEISNVPSDFLCTKLKTIMDDPVRGLCSHVFDKSVFKHEYVICPIDNRYLDFKDCVELSDVKKNIELFKSKMFKNPKDLSSTNISSEKKNIFTNFQSLTIKDNKSIQPFKVIKNAHFDDIHGFISISDNRFVSGSKDSSLKIWSTKGDEIKSVVPKIFKGYEYWVTALANLENGSWSSGTRDGYMTIWDKNNQDIQNFQYKPFDKSYICKNRNINRINCIKSLNASQIYIGTPRYIQLWDINKAKLIKYYTASKNDWVYCIDILENKDLVVVIGSNLQIWKNKKNFEERIDIIRERKEYKVHQRPHISSILRLQAKKNNMALALFDGSVKIIDLTYQKIVKEYQEHKGRVWNVENLNDCCFLSSADDKTIKIWDIRTQHSVLTLIGNPGRVSALLKLEENIFISASCPDEVFKSAEKASISFWDLRK